MQNGLRLTAVSGEIQSHQRIGRQPAIPAIIMPCEAFEIRTGAAGNWLASKQTDHERSAEPSCHSVNASSRFLVGSTWSGPSPFVKQSRIRYVNLLAVVLAITILCVAFVKPCFYSRFYRPGLSVRAFPHHARALTSSLLEVFQVYPPVLTVSPAGVLEITDGSSNATVDVLGSNRPTCQQVLVVHSFGNSYNNPFVGNYTPPKACSFNRVTWNLTVVSAGRQFDRLG